MALLLLVDDAYFSTVTSNAPDMASVTPPHWTQLRLPSKTGRRVSGHGPGVLRCWGCDYVSRKRLHRENVYASQANVYEKEREVR